MKPWRMAAAGDADDELRLDQVRTRFVWARRQGRPAWLWPDTPIEAWRLAMQGIADAAAAVLAGAGGVIL